MLVGILLSTMSVNFNVSIVYEKTRQRVVKPNKSDSVCNVILCVFGQSS